MLRSILSRADGVVSKMSRSLLILLESTNHPVCAAKERDLLLMAQPPLLEKEGNGPVSQPTHSPPPASQPIKLSRKLRGLPFTVVHFAKIDEKAAHSGRNLSDFGWA